MYDTTYCVRRAYVWKWKDTFPGGKSTVSSVPRVKDGRPVQDTFSEFLNETDNVI